MVRLWLCLCAPPFFFLLLLPFWWKCCPYINTCITSDDFSIRMLTSCAISSSPGEVFSIYIKDHTLQRLIKSLSLNIQSNSQSAINFGLETRQKWTLNCPSCVLRQPSSLLWQPLMFEVTDIFIYFIYPLSWHFNFLLLFFLFLFSLF